jgi:hypothetical protein
MAVTMKSVVLWNAGPCVSCKNRRLIGTYRFHHQGDKNRRASIKVRSNSQLKHTAKKYEYYTLYFFGSVLQLRVIANAVPSSLILSI